MDKYIFLDNVSHIKVYKKGEIAVKTVDNFWINYTYRKPIKTKWWKKPTYEIIHNVVTVMKYGGEWKEYYYCGIDNFTHDKFYIDNYMFKNKPFIEIITNSKDSTTHIFETDEEMNLFLKPIIEKFPYISFKIKTK